MIPPTSRLGAFAGPAFWKAAGQSAEGVLTSTTVAIDGPQSPERVAFIEAYRKRYNEEMGFPVSTIGSYDAVYLFKIAMERGGFEPDQIRDALEDIPAFKGW